MLEELKKWVSQGKRNAKITIDSHIYNDTNVTIWVFDYDLGVGDYIDDVSNINLDKLLQAKEKEEYKKLKLKYEKETV